LRKQVRKIKSNNDSKDTTIKAHKKDDHKVFSTQYKEDYSQASKDFWQHNSPNAVRSYEQGHIVGRFGKKNLTLPDFFDRIYNNVKEALVSGLKVQKKSANGLKDNLDAVKSTLQLLVKSYIDESGKDTKNVNKTRDAQEIIDIAAHMQGFINGYVESVIKDYIKTNKEE